MADIEIAIGSLRWPVTIARRRQLFDAPGAGIGIHEDYVDIQVVRAGVKDAGAMVFYGAQQTEPFTHVITVRWLDYLDKTNVILRDTRRPNGTVRTEIFAIKRVTEVAGRKRFSWLECQLEKVLQQPVGSAIARAPTAIVEAT